MMLHVGLLTSDFLPNTGGIAAHVAGLASGLQEVDCRVTVIVPQLASRISNAGIVSEVVSGVNVVRVRLWLPPLIRRFFFIWAQKFLLRRIVAEASIDVIHWHTPLAESEIVGAVRLKKRVFTNHTSQFLEWSLGNKDHRQARATLANAEVVICPSEELADATRQSGFPPERIVYIPNGVDPARFTPHVEGYELRRKLGISPSDVVILCPRRLEVKNGVTYWLDAIPETLSLVSQPVRFLLVGDYVGDPKYSDRGRVVDRISNLRLDDRLLWMGSVAPDQMPICFAASDVVVLPSLMEATSIAALEAMSTGKPVVATKVGGLTQLIEDGNTGLLVSPASSTELARAMATLIEHKHLRLEIGVRARASVVQSYSWRIIARKTLEAYASI